MLFSSWSFGTSVSVANESRGVKSTFEIIVVLQFGHVVNDDVNTVTNQRLSKTMKLTNGIFHLGESPGVMLQNVIFCPDESSNCNNHLK